MDIFTVLFYQPLYNLLIVLYRLFSENLGIAIILIALLSRFILLPITLRQMKMTSTGKEMTAKMNAIKKKYKDKNDRKEQQQAELMKVQSEYLPGQLAGCLPLILQLIFTINVYNVISNLILHGIESFNKVAYPFVPSFDPNYQLNTNLFGLLDLKTSAKDIGFSDSHIIPYLLIVVLVIITQFFSTKYMMNGNAVIPEKKEVQESKKGKSKDKDEKKPDDFGAIMQQSSKQTMYLLPIMIGLFSFSVASGVGIYWIAQSSFVIIQQFIARKLNKGKNTPNVI